MGCSNRNAVYKSWGVTLVLFSVLARPSAAILFEIDVDILVIAYRKATKKSLESMTSDKRKEPGVFNLDKRILRGSSDYIQIYIRYFKGDNYQLFFIVVEKEEEISSICRKAG